MTNMNSRTRDWIFIAGALLVIFGSGHVFGYLVGSRALDEQPAPEVRSTEWGSKTLDALADALELSQEQRSAIQPQVEQASSQIAEARKVALRAYHRELLDLHDRIAGHLNDSQRARLAESKAALQVRLDARFPDRDE